MNKIVYWLPFHCRPSFFEYGSVPEMAKLGVLDLVRSGHHVILPVLTTHAGIKKVFDGVENVEFVDVPAIVHWSEIAIPSDLTPISNRSDWTCMVNTDLGMAGMLLSMLTNRFTFFRPTILNYVTYSLKEGLSVDQQKEALFGLYRCGRILFNSDFCKVETMSLFSKYLLSSEIRDLKFDVVNNGINTGLIDRYRKDRSGSQLYVLYGGRLPSYKQVDLMVRLTEKARASGRNVAFRLNAVSDSFKKQFDDFCKSSCVIGAFEKPKSDFYEKCWTSDVFLGVSKFESYGLSFYEMLYGGCVGVFLNRPWISAVLPKDYPFVAGSETELERMFFWVLSNIEKAREMIKPFVAEIVKKHQIDVARANFGGVIDQLFGEPR